MNYFDCLEQAYIQPNTETKAETKNTQERPNQKIAAHQDSARTMGIIHNLQPRQHA